MSLRERYLHFFFKMHAKGKERKKHLFMQCSSLPEQTKHFLLSKDSSVRVSAGDIKERMLPEERAPPH